MTLPSVVRISVIESEFAIQITSCPTVIAVGRSKRYWCPDQMTGLPPVRQPNSVTELPVPSATQR